MEKTIELFEEKRKEFLNLGPADAINREKYRLMSISHHSAAIEGSSLTEDEALLLLNENKKPEGKTSSHSLMEKDHYDALLHIVREAKLKKKVTPGFIKEVSARVMKNTGGPVSAAAGNFDSSMGDFRKLSVFAGISTFPNHQQVEGLVTELCNSLGGKINAVSSVIDIYNLAFDFHFDLVTIHPFADGNGRVSRLLMNYILLFHELTPAFVHKADKPDYINSLKQSRNHESTDSVRKFLFNQQIQHYETEIRKYP